MDNIFNTRTKHTDLQGQQKSKGGQRKLRFPRGLVSGHHWCTVIKMAEM